MLLHLIRIMPFFGYLFGVDVYVDYQDKDCQVIPVVEIPANVTHLNLEKNQIQTIDGNIFEGNHVLRWIRIDFNNIRFIDKDAFTGTVLQFLFMNTNDLWAKIPGAVATCATCQLIHMHV